MGERITIPCFVRSLDRAFKVDQAINYATTDFVIIRFGVAADRYCKQIDEWIQEDAVDVNQSARIYMVENDGVPELVTRYGLSDNCTIIFFYKGTVGYRLPTAQILVEKWQKKMKFGVLAQNICESIRTSKNQRPRDRLANSMHPPDPISSISCGFSNGTNYRPAVGENLKFGYRDYLSPPVGENLKFSYQPGWTSLVGSQSALSAGTYPNLYQDPHALLVSGLFYPNLYQDPHALPVSGLPYPNLYQDPYGLREKHPVWYRIPK